MSWVGRTTALVAAVMVSAVACTAGSSTGGEGSGSCAYRILYQDRTYRDVANVKFTVGEKLGDATTLPCHDTGSQDVSEASGTTETVSEAERPSTETVYEVDGISPEVAIAVGDTPDEAKFVAAYSGRKLPPEVKKLIDGS